MQKVTAANQGNRPSVFDRLTSQAAQGNTAAAATASTVVRRLQRSAAAAKKQGNVITYGHDRLDQPDQHKVLICKSDVQRRELSGTFCTQCNAH